DRSRTELVLPPDLVKDLPGPFERAAFATDVDDLRFGDLENFVDECAEHHVERGRLHPCRKPVEGVPAWALRVHGRLTWGEPVVGWDEAAVRPVLEHTVSSDRVRESMIGPLGQHTH